MRDCEQCVHATTVWNGRPDELICVNAPGHAGRLTQVAKDQVCRSFWARARASIRLAPPEPPNNEVRYIALTRGLFAIVDAADYEWLSRHKWCATNLHQGSAYASCHSNGRTVLMHRLIMNPPDGMVVDHINGNKQDNRRCNLRVCTHAQNMRNSTELVGVCHPTAHGWIIKPAPKAWPESNGPPVGPSHRPARIGLFPRKMATGPPGQAVQIKVSCSGRVLTAGATLTILTFLLSGIGVGLKPILQDWRIGWRWTGGESLPYGKI